MTAPRCTILAILLVHLGVGAVRAQITPLAPANAITVDITPTVEGRLQNTGPYTATFTVTNTSTVTVTDISLACLAGAPVTCGTVSPTSRASLAAGASFNVSVGYSVGALGLGYVRLNATYDDINPKTSWDQRNVKSQAATAPGIALRNHNGNNLDRPLCLTTGAGESAANVCGDLVVTHAMPGFATMGRERSLTLVYNSRTAYYRPVVAVAATQGGNIFGPNTVLAELQVPAGTIRKSAGYVGWGGYDSTTRQIAISYDAPGASHPSGTYPFTLRLQNQYTSQVFDATLSDTLLVVNRSASRFGAGVWIAGLEQLVLAQPNQTLLWIGGDGSAKVYGPAGTNKWVAPKGSYRDTITYAPTPREYTRALRHGVKVVFDTLGRHIRTVNRTQQQTTFVWALDTLKSITVPPAGQSGTTYTFLYDGAGKLDRIVDPANRTLNVTITGGRLTQITDPDNVTTSFGYGSDNKLTSRTNRRGITTLYVYANGHRLTRVTVPAGTTTADTGTAVTQFQPWDEKGLAVGTTGQVAVDTALAYTKILGPRFLAGFPGDTAAFRVDKWNAPTKIVDANGATTTIVRGDANVPALVTQVTYANNRIVRMGYNLRGNLTSTRDSTRHIDLRPTQVQTYVYPTSGPAVDSPTEVNDWIGAEARKTEYKYNSLGLTDTVIAPNGHRTAFAYTTGAIAGLIDSITERNVETWRETASDDVTDTPLNQVHRFTYDAKGNLKTYNSPVGVVTSYVPDAIGRITDVYDPLKTRERRTYDTMNRVMEIQRYTGAVAHPGNVNPLGTHAAQGQPCDATQVLCVDSTVAFNPTLLPNPQVTRYGYNANGALDTIIDPRGMRRTFSHDLRELTWRAVDDYGQAQTASLNRAGATDYTVSRRGIRVNSYYDAFGRRTSLAYPQVPSLDPTFAPATTAGDSIRYTYDVIGNLTKARSNTDSIVRQYYADGLLKRKISSVGPDTQADTVSYEYDVTDAVTRVVHGRDTTDYAYHATTGALLTMTVRWGGRTDGARVFSFLWDALGRRRQITYPTDPSGPNDMTVKFRYDGAGVLRRVTSDHPGAPGGIALQDVFDFTFRNKLVDAAGRVWRQEVSCGGSQASGNACAGVGIKVTKNQYNRFGMLVRQEATGFSPEIMRYDGSGNMIHRERYDGLAAAYRNDNYLIDSASTATHNQLKRVTEANGVEIPLNILYTPDGARKWEKPDGTLKDYRETYYYYDGLGRMAGSVERDDDDLDLLHHYPGSCIYDPEGQLVVACNGGVYLSFDGQNVSGVLYNPQGSGWRFVHGPNTDDPLTGYHRLTPATETIAYYVTDGQGRILAVADSSGERSAEFETTSIGRWRLAGGVENGHSFNADRMGGGDVPKLSFYRNRAYDQTTGRWTQEDPLGVAGGLNLYQFNQNNPVMYTDPFGLRTCPPDCGAIHAVAGTAFGVVGAVAGGTVGTAGGPGGVVVGAVLGGASGFGAGVAAGNVAEAVGEAGAQAMGKIGRAIRTLVTGAMIGGSAVVPGTPEGGDATQGGTGTRSIPGTQALPAPPVVRPDTGTKAPPNPDEQVP